MALANMNSSSYLTPLLRERLSEFAVPVAIVLLAAASFIFPAVDTTMLALPATLQFTRGANATFLIPLLGVGPDGGPPAPAW